MAVNGQAGLATPPPDNNSSTSDIVSHYNHLVTSDPSITPAIAAIESLVAILSVSNLSTISELLTLLSTASSTLLASQNNSIPLTAGTELLQRYIITSVQQQSARITTNDFTQLRRHLISNSKLFVTRTKSARSKIAKHALPFIRDDSTIFAYGSSRVVDAIISYAAESNRYFHVIFISSSGAGWSHSSTDTEAIALEQAEKRLLGFGIPVVTIPLPALSHAIVSLPKPQSSNVVFLLGAEAVLENGAAISNLGSHLVASVAKANNIPAYFAAESYKFTRQFPTSCGDADLWRMGAKQEVLRFKTDLNDTRETDANKRQSFSFEKGDEGHGQVDITPPALISGLITESGIMTCEGVAEELIKLWF